MKKIILSFAALFAVSIASAQSYIKQPDPTTYNVVEYKAKKPVTVSNEVQPQATTPAPATTTTTTTTTTASAAATKVAEAPKKGKRVDEFTEAQVQEASKTAIVNDSKNKVATKDK